MSGTEPVRPPRLFHLALADEWSTAVAGGRYLTSTLGRTVAGEGFTHCSYAHQVAGVAGRFYADVTDALVVLEVDRARLTSPVVDEVPPGGDAAFPHVYGELDVAAVVAVHPTGRDGDGDLVLPAVVTASTPPDPST